MLRIHISSCTFYQPIRNKKSIHTYFGSDCAHYTILVKAVTLSLELKWQYVDIDCVSGNNTFLSSLFLNKGLNYLIN